MAAAINNMDDIEAEIARLQAEIEGAMMPPPQEESTTTMLEYIEHDSCMSFDEITVDTKDLNEYQQQQQQQPSLLSPERSNHVGGGLAGLLANLPDKTQRKTLQLSANHLGTLTPPQKKTPQSHDTHEDMAAEVRKRNDLLTRLSTNISDECGESPQGPVDPPGSMDDSGISIANNHSGATLPMSPVESEAVELAPNRIPQPVTAVASPEPQPQHADTTTAPSKKKKMVKKKVRKVRKKQAPLATNAAAATTDIAAASAMIDDEADALQKEIERMQSEIAATSTSENTTPVFSPLSQPSPPVPSSSTSTMENPALQKYTKMKKMGLPEGAILNAMERDGVDCALYSQLAGPDSQPSSVSNPHVSAPTTVPRAAPRTAAVPTSVPEPSVDPALQKYVKMKKMGLPEGAICNAMERDGVDPSRVSELQTESCSPSAPQIVTSPFSHTPRGRADPKQQSHPSVASASGASMVDLSIDPALEKYSKMQKIGLPQGAICNAMIRDGLDPSVFGLADKASPQPTNNQTRSKKPAVVTDIDDEAAALEAEIKRMEAELSGENNTGGGANAAQPSMSGLLGALEQAATKRATRLEETGGELLMQEIEPEVEARQTTPQLTTSMAEMISSKAAARDKRLADGGEKRMRKVEIKERVEYMDDFTKIMEDAAKMGRLTRLNEHTVEAVAQEKTREEEWRSNGLLAIQWRSNHMSVIHDAARAGNELKLPEKIVSNCEEEMQEFDQDALLEKPLSPRMIELLKLNNQAGEGLKKVDNFILGRKENKGKEESLLIKPMQAYSRIDDVKLPRNAPPKIDPLRNAAKLSKMKKEAIMGGRPMVDISVGVAEIAWSRRARLDRPGALPKMKETCDCPYCGTASPYQTHAYRVLEHKRREERLERKKNGVGSPQLTARLKELDEAEVEHEMNPQEEVNEVERKRLERKRVREERRKLQDAVAESTSAVDAAKSKIKTSQSTTAAKPQISKLPDYRVPPPSAPVRLHDPHQTAAFDESVDQQPIEAGCKCVIM